jgi:predicted nucleic acid-binding Zn ribbon protein
MKCSKCGQEIPEGSNFCEACGTKVPGTHYLKRSLIGWISLSVLCVIVIVVLSIVLSNTNDDLDYAQREWHSYKWKYENELEANQKAFSENASLKEYKKKVSGIYPIIITDIKIGNTYSDGSIETDYGNTLYEYNTMYLKPKVYYTGLTSGSKRLKIKWIRPLGDLSTGSSAPYGFSQAASYKLLEGENEIELNGWGGPNRGHWSSGTYRIEVWYNDICLKTKSFVIY